MLAYQELFARIYNQKWTRFAHHVAPRIQEYYETTSIGQENRSLLDLCCGTGQLAVHFLEAGYQVLGLDLSEHMLQYARDNAREYLRQGQAQFIQGDARGFQLEEEFGLVVSTYDALNHLEDLSALRSCFASVHAVCTGTFIFDLNTRKGLRRWNSIQVDESDPDTLIITRGMYDGESDRAWTKLSGLVKMDHGYYERFEETVFNTVFAMRDVERALLDTGWERVYFARIQDLNTPIAEPEEQGRVFVVARGN